MRLFREKWERIAIRYKARTTTINYVKQLQPQLHAAMYNEMEKHVCKIAVKGGARREGVR